ncbi:MAG: hypothetical protein OEP48_03650 [Betaproteobacteria bacterium]|nr:hypothetical protein [Betaproteobacteria bacterium]
MKQGLVTFDGNGFAHDAHVIPVRGGGADGVAIVITVTYARKDPGIDIA